MKNYIRQNVGLFLFCLMGIDYGIYAGFTEPVIPLVMIPILSIGMASAVSNIILDADSGSSTHLEDKE